MVSIDAPAVDRSLTKELGEEMLTKMREVWIWVVAIIDLVLSMVLAQYIVHIGWRYSYMLDKPLDASNSILAYTVMIGTLLPFFALFGGFVVLAFADLRERQFKQLKIK